MSMRGKGRQGGMTIIEMMAVVAVIGILTALLMPSVRSYAARAKVSEALVLFTNCRTLVQEIYTSASDLPGADNWGCEATNPSRFVSNISTNDDGQVKITLGNQVQDLRLAQHYITFQPLNTSGQKMTDLDLGSPVRRWRCGAEIDGTDVKAELLPSSCRGL